MTTLYLNESLPLSQQIIVMYNVHVPNPSNIDYIGSMYAVVGIMQCTFVKVHDIVREKANTFKQT